MPPEENTNDAGNTDTSLMGGDAAKPPADGDQSLLGGDAAKPPEGEAQTPEEKAAEVAAAAAAEAAKTPEEKAADAAAAKAIEDAKTPEEKAADAAAAKAAKDAEGAPDEYEAFTMAEGVELDTAMAEEFAPVAKDLDLNQEQAQKLVDLYAAKAQQIEQDQQDQLAQQRKDWRDEIRKDPKHEENLGLAKKALDKFAVGKAEGAKDLIQGAWLGDHPAIVGFLSNIGKEISEDAFIEGGGAGGSGAKTAAQVLYPSQK